MTPAEQYRAKAAELRAKAQLESNRSTQTELEGMAASYIRLADQADRNSLTNLVYENPPPKLVDPDFK